MLLDPLYKGKTGEHFNDLFKSGCSQFSADSVTYSFELGLHFTDVFPENLEQLTFLEES